MATKSGTASLDAADQMALQVKMSRVTTDASDGALGRGV
jgi:hypothetical protein